jgi:hypothetical protein
MAGEGWLGLSQGSDAFVESDLELLADARGVAEHFSLRTVGVDDMTTSRR